MSPIYRTLGSKFWSRLMPIPVAAASPPTGSFFCFFVGCYCSSFSPRDKMRKWKLKVVESAEQMSLARKRPDLSKFKGVCVSPR